MTSPTNSHALREQGEAANQSAANRSNYNPWSTATEAQNSKLLHLLQLRPHHSEELRKLGLYHPPARVRDLRQAGYPIATNRINLIDRDGFQHHGVALYSLIAESGGCNV